MKSLRQATCGAVYAEFLISFLPFFLLFVGGVQIAFIASARIVVQHAAVQAVRSAIVTIDDDPVFYQDGARKKLETKGSGKGDGAVQKVLGFAGLDSASAPNVTGMGARGSARLSRVRNAAYLPLSVVSPTREQVARWIPGAGLLNPDLDDRSLAAAVGDSPSWRIITGFGVYGRIGAALTFPAKPHASELRNPDDTEFSDHEPVTVRITYLYPCNVPLAREIACRSLVDMTGIPDAIRDTIAQATDPSVAGLKDLYDRWRDEFPDEWAAFKRDFGELRQAEWALLQLPLFAQTDEKFVIIRAEATLPNHGAAYRYYSELKQ